MLDDFNGGHVTMHIAKGYAFITASSLYMIPFETTQHFNSSSTLLYLCIVDDADKVMKYGQRDVAFLSAHYIIFIKYGVKVERGCGRTVVCRDWDKLDEDKLFSGIDEISQACWQPIASTIKLRFSLLG